MSTNYTTDETATYPEKLQAIITEFQEAEPRERLEYLLEYAMDLPDLPERLLSHRDNMEQVHECQTAVFLFTELTDGKIQFFLDIPKESPTVRGYAAILAEGLNGSAPEAILATSDAVYQLLGLHKVVTPQRLHGLHFLMRYMKRQVTNLLHQ